MEQSQQPRKKNPVATFLWVLLTFLFIYLLVTWLIPFRYRGVEDVSIHDLQRFMNAKTAALYYHPKSNGCKRMLPIYRNLSRKYPKIRFVTINASKLPAENVSSYPTFRLIQGKKTVREAQNVQSEEELKKNLDAVFKSASK